MKYVIKYTKNPTSYFRRTTQIGPQFGAALEESPKYDTRMQACEVIRDWPIAAAVFSEIEELP